MFTRISTQQAHNFLNDKTAQFVDIRDEQSFVQGCIPGSLSLQQHNLQDFIETADLDAPLLVCCYHGISSQSAAQLLHEKGFEQIYSIDGGFEAWQADFPNEIDR